ncbi:hypothetical protein [Streptomyces sp. NPDC056987]|uniref:hypothetical protein n=1 Tax=Streptomyces sp. NPDC056987 TaxID=3345988 RepID=UPI003627175B
MCSIPPEGAGAPEEPLAPWRRALNWLHQVASPVVAPVTVLGAIVQITVELRGG